MESALIWMGKRPDQFLLRLALFVANIKWGLPVDAQPLPMVARGDTEAKFSCFFLRYQLRTRLERAGLQSERVFKIP